MSYRSSRYSISDHTISRKQVVFTFEGPEGATGDITMALQGMEGDFMNQVFLQTESNGSLAEVLSSFLRNTNVEIATGKQVFLVKILSFVGKHPTSSESEKLELFDIGKSLKISIEAPWKYSGYEEYLADLVPEYLKSATSGKIQRMTSV